CQQHYSYPFTF
nr:immunoglobulin light chain junction region [Macaca mulatta]MOW40615.1 immunoglobulin light chain junction region [Macaca mulatta]MOW40676.1 immunoglobulin light chain junction region [Macaca mulatta]MOW40774.1 immunoglobulin light chain junction region [Macaca mulatta]MOW40778.1 immunoglobulin light chain junction region [Macaca mulatta]